MTDLMMTAFFMPGSPEYGLMKMLRTRNGTGQPQQIQQMMAEWSKHFPPGRVIPKGWEYEEEDPDVELVVSNRGLSYSAQTQGVSNTTSERTIDTFLGPNCLWRASDRFRSLASRTASRDQQETQQ